MKRYFFKLAYDGSSYFGWQRQPNEISVQEKVEEAMSLICKQEDLSVVGCGRTDTGVHASEYYLHVDLKEEIDKEKTKYKLNNFLDHSIAILDILDVESEAHARFDASSRSYQYFIHHSKDPFHYRYSYFLKKELDYDAMNKAADLLLQVDDFSSFCKKGSDNKTTICDVTHAKWSDINGAWRFDISADRFLRNMVRAIVGTLIEVGLGKLSPEEFKKIILSKERQAAGASAPAHALFLSKINYPYIA